jgi:hypothetical protein
MTVINSIAGKAQARRDDQGLINGELCKVNSNVRKVNNLLSAVYVNKNIKRAEIIPINL